VANGQGDKQIGRKYRDEDDDSDDSGGGGSKLLESEA
jgi:hypothetical protein